ncbi:MAG: hypothetical protein DRN81_04900 [Thermoproteota archaeon]|nr:MAG: hypothetical protein DRN81_04900 [Candidatus Korarchaeota archaeon]
MKIYQITIPSSNSSYYNTGVFVADKQSYVCRIEYAPETEVGVWNKTLYFYSQRPFTVKVNKTKMLFTTAIENEFIKITPDDRRVAILTSNEMSASTAYKDLLNWKDLYGSSRVYMSEKDYEWILDTLELLEIEMP